MPLSCCWQQALPLRSCNHLNAALVHVAGHAGPGMPCCSGRLPVLWSDTQPCRRGGGGQAGQCPCTSPLAPHWRLANGRCAGVFPFKTCAGVAREDTLNIDQIAAETDFIVLTQGIDDHAHRSEGAGCARPAACSAVAGLLPGASWAWQGRRVTCARCSAPGVAPRLTAHLPFSTSLLTMLLSDPLPPLQAHAAAAAQDDPGGGVARRRGGRSLLRLPHSVRAAGGAEADAAGRPHHHPGHRR